MPTHYAQYVDGRLRPFSEPVAEAWAEFSEFEVVAVKVTRGRNRKFNALYHTLLGYVRKALAAGGEEWTHDDLHREIKVHLCFYKVREMPEHIARLTGRTHEIDYISTNFDSMSEDAFREFVFKAVGVIEEHICPYLMESDWASKVDKIIAEFRK
jgi:hypothetical protein